MDPHHARDQRDRVCPAEVVIRSGVIAIGISFTDPCERLLALRV